MALTKQKIEEEKSEEHRFTEEQMLFNAEVTGICSVKYYDLKQNRV